MTIAISSGDVAGRNRRILEFLETEDFDQVLESVRVDIKDEWEGQSDPTEREELWYQLNALERLETRLASWANQAR